MYEYKAPLRDLEFTYLELLDYEQHLRQFPKYADLDSDTVSAVLSEYARFAEGVLEPLNRSGDEEGCRWEDGEVVTPKGFREAYNMYCEAGWQSLTYDVDQGGQGLPESLSLACMEIRGSANWSWTSLIGFGHAGAKTVCGYGSDALQQMFLPKVITGEWLGTMCLTEPHCGTDLGLMKTKAVPNADGTYSITGTKIFITSGDHDLTENILHIVLAKTPDAPEGTAGISAFVVSKYHINDDLSLGERNGVHCGSIEHKMGIKGSATCVMNFDSATGYLIGKENQGLRAMFLMMNAARVGTGLQGVCHAEVGLQKSTGYARDRLQMRSLSGPKNPDGSADPIIVHPDVRRMLLTQKAFAEGGRMFVAHCTKLVDVDNDSDDPQTKALAVAQLEFLTPILKAFLTETGLESSNLAMQCFGGHGYIREWGVEQNYRDCRIATLYEGTTGIQALDLLGRKVMGSKGELMQPFIADIDRFCAEHSGHPLATELQNIKARWLQLTQELGVTAAKDPDTIGAASVDYLMFSGYVVLAYFWARACVLAETRLQEGTGETDFYQSKVNTANFYFQRILPRTEGLAKTMLADTDSLMAMTESQFLAQI